MFAMPCIIPSRLRASGAPSRLLDAAPQRVVRSSLTAITNPSQSPKAHMDTGTDKFILFTQPG
jgi:hypothetical protein